MPKCGMPVGWMPEKMTPGREGEALDDRERCSNFSVCALRRQREKRRGARVEDMRRWFDVFGGRPRARAGALEDRRASVMPRRRPAAQVAQPYSHLPLSHITTQAHIFVARPFRRFASLVRRNHIFCYHARPAAVRFRNFHLSAHFSPSIAISPPPNTTPELPPGRQHVVVRYGSLSPNLPSGGRADSLQASKRASTGRRPRS